MHIMIKIIQSALFCQTPQWFEILATQRKRSFHVQKQKSVDEYGKSSVKNKIIKCRLTFDVKIVRLVVRRE